jgi:membrane-bound lytic murein transglycosylase D
LNHKFCIAALSNAAVASAWPAQANVILLDSMKWLISLLAFATLSAAAQPDAISIQDLVREGQRVLEENIDPEFLKQLPELDEREIEKLLRDLHTRLQGGYVLDLAALQPLARSLVPILESHPDTKPYSTWLKSRLDYFEVAEHFKPAFPPKKAEPGKPQPPSPNPTPEAERNAWKSELSRRPMPPVAQNLVPRLKPIFSNNKVPAELVWLAEVESAFDPNARSPVGAAGLYQLMPETAKGLGVSLRPRDQRYDPEVNARAASKYLHYLYGKFRDWRLALAAYNCGEGRIRTLLKKHKAKTFDQISPYLPAETQMYVPKFEATLLRREGLAIGSLKPPTG